MWLKLAPFWAGPTALIFLYYAFTMHRSARPLAAKIFFFLGCAAVGVVVYYFVADPTYQQVIDLIKSK